MVNVSRCACCSRSFTYSIPLSVDRTTAAAGLVLSTVLLASDGVVPGQAPAGKNFPTVGGNLANQRYSSLTRITKANVSHLGGAWMVHLEDGQPAGTMQATPVVIDGVIYIATGIGNVFAVDGATGAIKWKYRSGGRPGSNRGVAVGDGRVYAGQRDNTLVALDQKTGARLWRTELAAAGPGTTSAPATYHDGLVYIGIGGGELGVRGQFGAYDAKTGKEVWKFWTIPAPGERGQRHMGRGVVAVRRRAGVDAAGDRSGARHRLRRRRQCRTGQRWHRARAETTCSPCRSSRSISKTGAYKWHFQEVHHDLWDYDNAAAPVLADIRFKGRTRQDPDARRQDRDDVHPRSRRPASRSSASRSARCRRNRG